MIAPMPTPRARPAPALAVALVLIVGAACTGIAGAVPTAAGSRPVATATATATLSAMSPAPPPPATGDGSVDLVAAGDIARCEKQDDDDTGRLAASLPGAVAVLGDIAYESGTAAELAQCFGPAWGLVQDRIRWAVTGNHDVVTDNGKPMRDYFGAAASRDGLTYFSDEYGAWHVIVLDANCDEVQGGCAASSPQVRWLVADLAASHGLCTLAMWHQPRFSSGVHQDDPGTAPFWDALYAAGADLVIGGHDHDYERFAPQDPSGAADPARGTTEIVVGTGGAPLREFKATAPNSLVRISDRYGVLALQLAPTGWTSRFLATDGSIPDAASGTCH
jgi:acid phosphatase type 7